MSNCNTIYFPPRAQFSICDSDLKKTHKNLLVLVSHIVDLARWLFALFQRFTSFSNTSSNGRSFNLTWRLPLFVSRI